MYGATDNAGAGLFVTRQLSQATGRYFALASGDAMFRSSAARRLPADDKLVFPIAPFSGTLVCVEIGLSSAFDYSRILQDAWARLGRREVDLSGEDVIQKVIFT
jgi:hypothetical protein